MYYLILIAFLSAEEKIYTVVPIGYETESACVLAGEDWVQGKGDWIQGDDGFERSYFCRGYSRDYK